MDLVRIFDEHVVDWVPTFGGNMLGWVPTWALIMVVLLLGSVIVVLTLALRDRFENEDKKLPPLVVRHPSD